MWLYNYSNIFYDALVQSFLASHCKSNKLGFPDDDPCQSPTTVAHDNGSTMGVHLRSMEFQLQTAVKIDRKAPLSDISQITSKSVEIVPPLHRQGKGIPFVDIRGHEFGYRPPFGRPCAQIFRHSGRPLLSLSPGRRFSRPTPERVFAVDHRSGSGFSGTVPSAPRPRPIGT